MLFVSDAPGTVFSVTDDEEVLLHSAILAMLQLHVQNLAPVFFALFMVFILHYALCKSIYI